MIEIHSVYNPSALEDKWYKYWLENKYFESTPDDREPYCIVIPPPNVTGVLHMGHMLNNTLQDILVRRARMTGKNALWIPGTDHASIATEAKVVEKLDTEGIKKSTLTREVFLEHAWEWTRKHGGIILEQLKKLGASCAWERTAFTMDDTRYSSVIKVFCDLYDKGLIYKGNRMVNWDPKAQTALSDEEVIFKDEKSSLYYVRYQVYGTNDEWVTVATTRPETILGDTAVCVNPNDHRFRHLKGKNVIVPLVNRIIPIIEDEYVDMEFGTGCLKITPAHDLNDYNLGKKHNLEVIDTFNPDGTLNANAKYFIGEDRFVVRKKIAVELEKLGNIVKIEDYNNKVGYSERTDVIIEPRVSQQWFLKMQDLSKPALENVMNDNIKFYPAKFKNTYKHWIENVQDWCISRQLWWGQRIPAYYLPNGQFVIAENIELALEKARKIEANITKEQLHQDEDALDTWFSSWLWPIALFDGINNPDNNDINYYYPTTDLVTAPDIIFFWVARMIIAGYEYQKDLPFKNVYFTGIVRDKKRRKMSKSLGNSPDPLDLIDKYGADGVRVGMLLCSSAGNDLLFDEALTEQGRNFSNKIWNAFRLVKSFKVEDIATPEYAKEATLWFENKLNDTINQIDKLFKEYKLSEALMSLYNLFWDDFCSWYLEMIKPGFEKPMDKATYKKTIVLFDKILKLLHPFMPFITEEIWQYIEERKQGESIMVCQVPTNGSVQDEILKAFEDVQNITANVRTIRKEKNILNKLAVSLFQKSKDDFKQPFVETIKKLNNISDFSEVAEKPSGAASFNVNTVEYFLPLGDLIDKDEEIAKLQKELDYTIGFLASVMKKLDNEKFVSNAPANVLELENKKKSQAEEKIASLEFQIKELKK